MLMTMGGKIKKVAKQAGWIACCCCFFVFLSSANSPAGQNVVRIVVSSDAGPYLVAADALRSTLTKQPVIVQSFTLEAVQKQMPAPVTGESNEAWVAVGSRAAAYLHSSLAGSLPLVYCMVAKPESIGLVNGMGNISGVAVTLPIKEQFNLIEQSFPELKSIGVLYRSTSANSVRTLNEVREQLPADWRLIAVNIDASGSMARAIAKLFVEQVDLIWTVADSAVYNRSTVKALLLASLRNKTPVFGFSGSFVKAGALLGIEADSTLQGQYAAMLVREVFTENGSAEHFQKAGVSLAVNMVVADRLGISLPEAIVQKSHIIGAR